jgi:hypothetical protein
MAILQHIERMIDDASMTTMDNELLHGFIDQLQICLGYLHNSITETYFPSLTAAA